MAMPQLYLKLLLIIATGSHGFDPCKQPIGMENGLIKEDQIKLFGTDDSNKTSSVRLQSTTTSCNKITGVEVKLRRFMTITGFAFQSDTNIDGIIVRYGVDGYYQLQSWKTNYKYNLIMKDAKGREKRTFSYAKTNNQIEEIMFEDHPFSLLYIKIELPSKSCFKFELFGCADTCSSILRSPKLFPLNDMPMSNGSFSWCPASKEDRNIVMHRTVTVSGVSFEIENHEGNVTGIGITCYKNKTSVGQFLVDQKSSQRSFSYWFAGQLHCDMVSLNVKSSTCMKFSLVGCGHDCTLKLGIKDYRLSKYPVDVRASSITFARNITNITDAIQPAKEGFLYNIGGSWLADPTDRDPWIQVCFNKTVLVSGVAIQAQGFFGYGRITSYVLEYSYGKRNNYFQYTENNLIKKFQGPNSRFHTKWNELNMHVTGKCFKLNKCTCKGSCALRWELFGCQKGAKPIVTIETQQIIGSGLDKTITCSIYGQPGTSLQWKNISGVTIKNNSYYSIRTNINNISDLNVSYSYTLHMMKEMREYWGRSKLNCNHGDNGEKLVNCSSVFTCTAFYVEDEKVEAQTNVTFQFNRTVGKPIIKDYATTNSSISFAFEPPRISGDFPVVGYNVTIFGEYEKREVYRKEKTLRKTFSMPRLSPMQRYSIKIYGCNQFGIWSQSTEMILTTKGASFPRHIRLSKIADKKLTFSWGRPNIVEGRITGYTLECRKGRYEVLSNTCSTNCTTSLTIDGLAPNSRYSCKIKAMIDDVYYGSWSIKQSFWTSLGAPCHQAVGIGNGMIVESNIIIDEITTTNITTNNITRNGSIRLNNDLCADDTSNVQVDLRRLMTITGLTFYSDVQTEITIPFDIYDENPQNDFNILRRRNSSNQRKFKLKKGFTRMWFEDDPFTLRYIKVMFSQIACVQLEIYGCAEICSSRLTLPTLSKNMRNQNTSNNSMKTTISLTRPITISGLMLLPPQPASVEISLNCSSDSQIFLTVPGNTEEGITVWFEEDLLCKDIEAGYSIGVFHSNISFLGCDSECARKLGVKRASLTVSSSQPNHEASESFMNNMKGSWLVTKGEEQWIQACFNDSVLVSGVAIQSQGNQDHARLSSFTLSVSYEPSRNKSFVYRYNDNVSIFSGPSNRYAMKLNQLDTAVTGRCFTLANMTFIGVCAVKWELIGCKQGLKPQISVARNTTFTDNIKMSLKCEVHGQPRTTLLWEIDGSMITNDDYYNVSSLVERRNSDLNISYTSHLGISNKILNYFVNRTDSQCKVTDVNNTIDCTLTYTCKAFYVESETIKKDTVVSFKYNGNVGIPKTTSINVTDSSAYIAWKPSRDFFLAVAYNVSISEVETKKIVYQNITYKANLILTGLHVYREYEIRVISSNRFNITSQASVRRFITSQFAPSNVKNFKVFVNSSNKIHVTWDPPIDVKGILSSYFIEWIDGNGNGNKTDTNETQLTITGLEAFANYTVKLRASTNDNELLGTWSSSTVKTMEGIPTLPIGLEAIKENDAQLKIQWMKPNKMNGIFKRYQIVYTATKDYYREYDHVRSDHTSITEFTIKDILPGTNYTIYVQAVSGGGAGDNATIVYISSYTKPNIANMSLSNKTIEESQQIKLNPIPPLTGPIKYYELAVSPQQGAEDCFQRTIFTDEFNLDTPEKIIIDKGIEEVQFRDKKFKLELIGKYRICLRAVVDGNLCGNSKIIMIERRDLTAPSGYSLNGTSIDLSVPKGPETTRFYVIIVSRHNMSTLGATDMIDFKGYDKAHPGIPYITAIFERYFKRFTIGSGESYKQFKFRRYRKIRNIKLKLDTKYFVSVRAHVHENDYFSSPWISVRTLKGVESGRTRNITQFKLLMIIIAANIVIILICVVIGGIIFRQRQKKKCRCASRCSSEVQGSINKGIQLDNLIVDPTVAENPPKNVKVNPKYPPVKLIDLPIYWRNLQKNCCKRLVDEFKSLDRGQLFQWSDAMLPKLKVKNRYANIVAYNHSRVKLRKLNNFESDYVNASYIHGYCTKNMYIASQGPSISSLNDFWQLIWEQSVSVIVMLTNLVEQNKRICEQYWPDSGTKTYGQLEVTILRVERLSDYTVRSFSINKPEEDQPQIVHHYHFTSWPDHRAPQYPSEMLNFLNKIRKDHPNESLNSPILCHCSAGVGRTGAFICVDNMLKLAKERQVVDVFNYVNFMRSRRIDMVQTEDQYLFIYCALLETVACGNTIIEISRFNQENKKLLERNETGRTGYQVQFEKLNSMTKSLTREEISVAIKQSNIAKNLAEIYPRDVSRVSISCSSPDAVKYTEGYINAVYVNSYKNKNAFIVTHHPLQSTVYDFWKMILDKKVVTVVMLHSLQEDKTFGVYWPTLNGRNKYRDITVTADGNIYDGKFPIINVVVSHNNHNEDKTQTTIICYDEWREDGVHKNPHDLIQLNSKMEACNKHSLDSPVVVMCSDGAGRSGTFIAISILVEQLMMEQTVDVFQIVKKIRTTRPEFVQNVEQYQLCYSTIQAYLNSLATYSNLRS